MGSVHVDIHKRAKALHQRFPMHTPQGVLKFMSQIHRIRGDRLRGDMDASDLLIDFMQAYRAADLSEREREVIYWRFERQLNQRETAKVMEISRQSVDNYEGRAAEKIAHMLQAMED